MRTLKVLPKTGLQALSKNREPLQGGRLLEKSAALGSAIVHIPNVNGSAEPPVNTGSISPGKNDLGDGASVVATYAGAINRNWESGVDAFMKIARLCAEASELLNSAQRATLVSELLFGEATFSKFARIGKDTRLHTPEI